jgi:predicted nucleic acid-binding protein
VLVLDAHVALRACGGPHGFDLFGGEELVAPPLMWSESRSALREAVWRGETSTAQAERTLAVLDSDRIAERRDRRVGGESWRLAVELGWAKTYDAEYVALARLLGCRLVTLDARLRRGTEHLGFVVAPSEL